MITGDHGLSREYPFRYASRRGHLESVLEMVPYVGQTELDNALCCAAYGGHSTVVTALLEKTTASPNAAIICAVESGNPKVVRVLLRKGADVHTTRKPNSGFLDGIYVPCGATILHRFAESPFISETAASEILNMLLAAGANLEARDACGNTPILAGDGMCGNISTTKLLLEAGSNPNADNHIGDTVLHRACRKRSNIELVELLLDYKADPEKARSSDGLTPLQWWVGRLVIFLR